MKLFERLYQKKSDDVQRFKVWTCGAIFRKLMFDKRNTNLIKTITIIFVIITIVFMCFNGAAATEYETEDGYNLIIPDDWVQIPFENLDAFSDRLYEMSPEVGRIEYDYGFQPSSNPEWLSYPYILVKIKNTGRIPERELKNIPKVKKEFEKGMSKVEDALDEILQDVELGKPVYDEEYHILFSNMKVDVVGVGKVKALMSLKLTKTGIIHILGYALENEYDYYHDIYTGVARGIILDPSLEYSSSIADNIPFISNINWKRSLMVGFVFALIGGIFSIFRKKKN